MARARRRTAPALCAALALAAAAIGPRAGADEAPGPLVFLDGLTARGIYERVLENRFRAFAQRSTLVSADRAGRRQESRFRMKWQDFREAGDDDGVLAKALVVYTHPFDLRHSGYLIQTNDGRPADQFVYYPSRRRVVRVNLRSEAIYGTDFSFEDVVPRQAQDFDYRRLPDATLGDVPVHVLELFPKAVADSEYSKILIEVDRERFVVLRARYWDGAGVAVKELTVDDDAVQRFDDVWVVMRSTMRNLQLDSWTRLEVEALDPAPGFDARTFDLSRLEAH